MQGELMEVRIPGSEVHIEPYAKVSNFLSSRSLNTLGVGSVGRLRRHGTGSTGDREERDGGSFALSLGIVFDSEQRHGADAVPASTIVANIAGGCVVIESRYGGAEHPEKDAEVAG